MYNFIVGGYLPGTNDQLSFQAWVIITCAVAVTAYASWQVFQRLKQFSDTNLRQGLHASQLHIRFPGQA